MVQFHIATLQAAALFFGIISVYKWPTKVEYKINRGSEHIIYFQQWRRSKIEVIFQDSIGVKCLKLKKQVFTSPKYSEINQRMIKQ